MTVLVELKVKTKDQKVTGSIRACGKNFLIGI